MALGPEYSSPTPTKYDPNHDADLQDWRERTLQTRLSLSRAKMENETDEEFRSRQESLQVLRDIESEHILNEHRKAGDPV